MDIMDKPGNRKRKAINEDTKIEASPKKKIKKVTATKNVSKSKSEKAVAHKKEYVKNTTAKPKRKIAAKALTEETTSNMMAENKKVSKSKNEKAVTPKKEVGKNTTAKPKRKVAAKALIEESIFNVMPENKKVCKSMSEKAVTPKKEVGENTTAEPKGKTAAKALAAESIQDVMAVNMFEDGSLWYVAEMLSYIARVPFKVAKNFILLLSDGCTLPFIARYRKTAVGHLMPDRLQDLFDSYQKVCQLKKKVDYVLAVLKKKRKLSPEIEKRVLDARNLSELEVVYAPFKPHPLTPTEKAKNFGLESYGHVALHGALMHINRLCTIDEELSTVEKVEAQLTLIIADIIYTDEGVLKHIKELQEECDFIITSSRKTSTKEKKKTKNKMVHNKTDPETYKIYFDWKCSIQHVKPHQTLALNRGEDENVLSVKVVFPDWFFIQLERFCLSTWPSIYWVRKGLTDAYSRLIKPWVCRQVRTNLTCRARKEAVKTFVTNLEKFLLTEPIKNKVIAGLDPGFRAGCKLGIINANGDKLETYTLYPDLRKNNPKDPAAQKLKELLKTFRVELIGLGNGTGCRETETWLKYHQISENIPVIIVPEQGVSVYSISKEAQKEHPNMDPNLISALSIARRVLDPLGELIKVDPKHLGVGMYQHDIPPKMLEAALNSTVEKVVSLVGVDINTASQAMLRRISGLNDSRAKKLIAYRQANGSFTTRADILKVPGIGKITFQQCAGFLKVLEGDEPLDTTIIHPESYDTARFFAKKIGVRIKDLSKPNFPEAVEMLTESIDIQEIIEDLDTDIYTLELIMNAFKQKPHEENLIMYCRPVYSHTVQVTEQIRKGMSLTGVVRNVVSFGCFVDCGVGDSGLIHRSKFAGNPAPKLGDRVAVTVLASSTHKKLHLQLVKILD